MNTEEDPSRYAPGGVSADGSHVFHWPFTPNYLTDHVVLQLQPKEVLPIIFIPGIMGSNLRSNGKNGKPKDPVWRLDNSKVLNISKLKDKPTGLVKSMLGVSAGRRQRMLHPSLVEVDPYGAVPEKSCGSISDLNQYRNRGWGEVGEGSYHDFLLWLEKTLNGQEQECARLKAIENVLKDERNTAVQFAQEPLAVLAHVSICALGQCAAEKVTTGKSALESRSPAEGVVAIRHTALVQFDQDTLIDRYQACFDRVLKEIGDVIRALPECSPLSVHLQLPPDLPRDVLLALWKKSWIARKLSPASVDWIEPSTGIMALDHWLDIQGGKKLERFALFFGAQLRDKHVIDSAEAAAAVLLAWAPLAKRESLVLQALLHRPVESLSNSISDVGDMASRSLLWGAVSADQTQHLWQASTSALDEKLLAQVASDFEWGIATESGMHIPYSVNAAIGHAGVASAWLGIALAVEHSLKTKQFQVVASREETLRAAVIRPAGSPSAEQDSV